MTDSSGCYEANGVESLDFGRVVSFRVEKGFYDRERSREVRVGRDKCNEGEHPRYQQQRV